MSAIVRTTLGTHEALLTVPSYPVGPDALDRIAGELQHLADTCRHLDAQAQAERTSQTRLDVDSQSELPI